MEAATQMLKRAVELELAKKYPESKVCYEEGIEILLKSLPSVTDEAHKAQIRTKVASYMERAEKLKTHIVANKKSGTFHEKIEIKNNQRGCSYATLFTKYIDDKLTRVSIDDAYLRSHHQHLNLLRFCELLLKKAKNLKFVIVKTGSDAKNESEQKERLSELCESMRSYGVTMSVEFSQTIHDREITFDNGWIIKIGRGLDYFKSHKGRTSIGFCDMDLRECHETNIDIYDAR